MYGMKGRDNRRWVIEFLQIYHMTVLPIRQGWHQVDVFANRTAAENKLSEYQHWSCQLRIRRLEKEEDSEYDAYEFE